MGKGQSKSYDISTNPQKASHKRPKSSNQRESLLLSRNSTNIDDNTQLNNQPNGDKSPTEQKPDNRGDHSVETKKSDINGIADNNSNLESHEKQKDSETPVVTENNKQEVETLDSKGEPSEEVQVDSAKDSSESNSYNPKEESDQIDKALEDYIESQKREESKEKEDIITEESDLKEEVEESEQTVTVELSESKEEVPKEDNQIGEEEQKEDSETKPELKEDSDKVEVIIKTETEFQEEDIIKTETEFQEENIIKTGTEFQEEVQEVVVTTDQQEESDVKEAVEKEEVETETSPDTPRDTEDKPVVESETVQFNTVISLETTPPGSDRSPQEADTREGAVDFVEPQVDIVPPAEPVVPVEEPTLPESASLVSSELVVQVSSEVDIDMASVEAVVCEVDDLKDGEMREVDVGEGKALLVRENGQFYALGNKCTHYGAPLAKGALNNGRVRCPWHGACFNVKTGDIEDFPGLDSLPKFDVTVADGKVKVKGDKALLTSSKVQKSMCKQSADNQKSVLIVGGGPASVMCAETLRKEGFTGKITIATQERHLPYDRIKLSKAMDSSADAIVLRNADFYKTNGIDILNNKKATSVDSQAKIVKFEDESSLNYTSLVIATGGKPRQLPINGADFENVCLLRTPDDANKIAEAAKGKKVVIIGSSFIGMEVAAFLADKAESVSVVDIIKVPFQLVLGEKVGSVLQKLHEDQGVKFYFERGIKEFTGNDNRATEAVLSDDTKLPCDLAILGVGVVPATDFLKDSDITMTNRGFIPVDKNMKTNVDGIYAAGDIVEFPLFTAGDQQVNVQHWQMAHAHGKAAALGILEKNEDVKSVPFFWTMMYKKSIRYTGYGFGYDDIVVHGDLDAPNFTAFYTKGDEVVAVATLGTDPVAAQVAEIMYAGQKILKAEIQDSVDAVVEKFAKL
ncbi:apoptosis-inducing factor 3-like isoform X1 [Mytilus californianus]|uniref:apoptosis-inducing factor 3-like isoform X1 n=1 Tax=Mytilus californianus TaxID=6549 RepID=UPI0022472D4B|nr:apoptosis-inducing factor 3-like isoform X1 [Mytilus californianus]XP_052074367.1 apoptosis-inducing factor 3-like isoform X1 [Mytilus californianus]XP_052074369.1 apoptosis-inducing factor 3-like isoform X1 [Mytilus californianus]